MGASPSSATSISAAFMPAGQVPGCAPCPPAPCLGGTPISSWKDQWSLSCRSCSSRPGTNRKPNPSRRGIIFRRGCARGDAGQHDSWLVFHVGRAHYSEALKAGVKLHEREDALLHVKGVAGLVDAAVSSLVRILPDRILRPLARRFVTAPEIEDIGRDLRVSLLISQ